QQMSRAPLQPQHRQASAMNLELGISMPLNKL
ncbi:hypothetical protein WJ66_02923, partial [Stenotrophomonas maltophilia WJ66]